MMRSLFCGLFFLAAASGFAATFNVREFGAKADQTNNDAPGYSRDELNALTPGDWQLEKRI
jgi:hypothetical protein